MRPNYKISEALQDFRARDDGELIDILAAIITMQPEVYLRVINSWNRGVTLEVEDQTVVIPTILFDKMEDAIQRVTYPELLSSPTLRQTVAAMKVLRDELKLELHIGKQIIDFLAFYNKLDGLKVTTLTENTVKLVASSDNGSAEGA
ncbi:MAG: hypothetical protein JWP44_4139 [Mucilaginibacter sp.]|nr:hypothetical protein [Mucilaginibacter sp.]